MVKYSSYLVSLLLLFFIMACSKYELVNFQVVEGVATGNRFTTSQGEVIEVNIPPNPAENIHVNSRYWPNTLPAPQVGNCVKIHARVLRDLREERDYKYESTGLLFIPCDFDTHVEERVVEAKVSGAWKAGGKRFVRVVTQISSVYGKVEDFDEEHFGQLNPNQGDCVKVWVSDFHTTNTEVIRILNTRDLAPCEK